MDPITLRLEDGTVEELDAEYEERGFRNRTVYLRRIIDQRDALFDEDGGEIDVAGRLADMEERLAGLEEQAQPFAWEKQDS